MVLKKMEILVAIKRLTMVFVGFIVKQWFNDFCFVFVATQQEFSHVSLVISWVYFVGV
jgi:hypothetical protein